MKHPTDFEIDALLHAFDDHIVDDVLANTDDPSAKFVEKNLSEDVPDPKPISDEAPRKVIVVEEPSVDVPVINPIPDKPLRLNK